MSVDHRIILPDIVLKPPTKHKYTWQVDKKDFNDDYMTCHLKFVHGHKTLPPLIDLRTSGFMPPIYDQGQLGSCTANAICGAFEFVQKKQGYTDFMPSRLFLYFCERAVENTVGQDSGAEIRDGMKVLNRHGVCTEVLWPYDITVFTQLPSLAAYDDALLHKSTNYQRINVTLQDIKAALVLGYPVVFGFSVPQSFESQQVETTGIMLVPQPGEPSLGGHAVVAVGYDDSFTANGHTGYLLVRNSWGTLWGQSGYFQIPYNFMNYKNTDSYWIVKGTDAGSL